MLLENVLNDLIGEASGNGYLAAMSLTDDEVEIACDKDYEIYGTLKDVETLLKNAERKEKVSTSITKYLYKDGTITVNATNKNKPVFKWNKK